MGANRSLVNNLFFAGLLSFVVLAGTADGQVVRLDFSNRVIPFEVTQDNVLSGTLESRTVAASYRLEADAVVPAKNDNEMFALLVPKAGETTVTVNGKRITARPEDRRSQWVYPVFSSLLNVGENRVEIEREHEAGWAGVKMFSLLDGYEEAHFPMAFGLPAEEEGGVSLREYAPTPLQVNYDVLWYDCVWRPRIGQAYLEPGTQVIIGAKAVTALNQIELDFDLGGYSQYQGSITVTAVDRGVGTDALSWQNVPNRNFPRMRINLDRMYAAGEEFQVRVAYHGAPNRTFPKSIFGTRPAFESIIDPADGPVIYSLNQPYGARRWFPCKDHPSDKADFTKQKIIVANTHGNLFAVSNGNLISQTVVGGNTEFVYEHNYPIAPYLMSVAIANYLYGGTTYTSQDGTKTMPLGAYVRPSAAWEINGWQGTLQVINFFADAFGEYPFIDEKYVTAAWDDTFAIEHQTATSMPSGDLGNGLGRRNVHEAAHHWFGNKMTTHDWDHTWLNEGFATYCEALFVEHAEGYNNFRNLVKGWSIQSGPIINPNADAFGGAQYRRGARVLDSLRFVVGKEAFFKIMKDYAAVGFETAISQPDPNRPDIVDFQSVAEQSAGLPAGSLQKFFDQWLYAGGDDYADRPTFAHSVAYDVETSSVRIRVKQTQSGLNFEMPVEFRLTNQDNQSTSVRVPANTALHVAPLGDFVPAGFEMDPDGWMLRSLGLRFTTVNLPTVSSGNPMYLQVGTAGNSNRSVSKRPGSPTWLAVASNGVLTGQPPAPGVYPVNLRLSSGSSFIDVEYKLVVTAGTAEPPTPNVVINEVAYETRGSHADFIELKNNEEQAVDISGWSVTSVDWQANLHSSVTIPPNTILNAGDYYVVGNAALINPAFPGAVDLDTGWTNVLPDGQAAVVLRTASNQRVDTLAYRSDAAWGSGAFWTDIVAEGGSARLISRGFDDPAINNTLGRLPDGADTGNNLRDFAAVPASPGKPNTGTVTLPFFDDFEEGIRPEWRPAFQVPLRLATPGGVGKPSKVPPAPAGGQVLEVFDTTGGGDVNYLSGAFEQLNFEGYIWIPQSEPQASAWSTGLGINTRVDSAWFSSSDGFEIPNGFYLEYQNGPGIGLYSGMIPNAPGEVRLLAVDGSSVPGAGMTLAGVTVLGQKTVAEPENWYPFRMIYDRSGDRLMASLGDMVIYDGPIPEGGYNTSGGISIGFRENHSGNPSATNREGTWVDNIRLDLNVDDGSSVENFELY